MKPQGFRAVLRGIGQGIGKVRARKVKVPYVLQDTLNGKPYGKPELGYAEVLSPHANPRTLNVKDARLVRTRGQGKGKGFRKWWDQLKGRNKHSPLRQVSRLIDPDLFAYYEARANDPETFKAQRARQFYRLHPECLPSYDPEGKLSKPRFSAI